MNGFSDMLRYSKYLLSGLLGLLLGVLATAGGTHISINKTFVITGNTALVSPEVQAGILPGVLPGFSPGGISPGTAKIFDLRDF